MARLTSPDISLMKCLPKFLYFSSCGLGVIFYRIRWSSVSLQSHAVHSLNSSCFPVNSAVCRENSHDAPETGLTDKKKKKNLLDVYWSVCLTDKSINLSPIWPVTPYLLHMSKHSSSYTIPRHEWVFISSATLINYVGTSAQTRA